MKFSSAVRPLLARSSVLFVLPLLLSACATTTQLLEPEVTEGEWKAKVLIRDKKKDSSSVVYMDIKSIGDEKLRVDVTLPAGLHLATLVLVQDKLQYIVVRDRKYFEGRPQPEVLKPLLGIPLDPRVVFNILYDKPVEQKGWSCTETESGKVADCQGIIDGINVKWGKKSARSKTVYIDHSRARLQMNFFGFRSKVDRPEKAFALKVPAGFKKYRIN